jgi:hypothetical protein
VRAIVVGKALVIRAYRDAVAVRFTAAVLAIRADRVFAWNGQIRKRGRATRVIASRWLGAMDLRFAHAVARSVLNRSVASGVRAIVARIINVLNVAVRARARIEHQKTYPPPHALLLVPTWATRPLATQKEQSSCHFRGLLRQAPPARDRHQRAIRFPRISALKSS